MRENSASQDIASYQYIGSRTLLRSMKNGVNLDFRSGSGTLYDGAGRPLQHRHATSGGTTRVGQSQAWSPDGNVTRQVHLMDTLTDNAFTYDPAGRLTAASDRIECEWKFLEKPRTMFNHQVSKRNPSNHSPDHST